MDVASESAPLLQGQELDHSGKQKSEPEVYTTRHLKVSRSY